MNQLRWRLSIIAVLTLWAAYIVAPSVIYFSSPKEIRNSEEEMTKRIPSFLPRKHVSLGLDLQGGVQLVLGVSTDNAVDTKLNRMGTEAQRWSDDKTQGIAKVYNVTGKQILRIELKDGIDPGTFKEKFRLEYPGLTQRTRNGQVLDFAFEEDQIKHIKASSIEQAEKVVRNRIDKWGVSEPQITRRKADNSILVQLPGFKDPGKAKELLGRTAQLKFKLVDDKFDALKDSKDLPAGVTLGSNGGQPALMSENRDALLAYVKGKIPDDKQLYLERVELAGGKKASFTTYVVDAATEIGGDDILDSFVTEDTQGLERRPEVSMRFTGPGGKRFGDLTGANVGRRLAIVLDDVVVSAPVIQSKIANGQGRITLGNRGGFEKQFQEAQQLALILKSGALPATIEVLEERQVGASLGPELADEGIKGLLVGLFFVLAYMVYYYKRPGGLACIALCLNGLFLLAMMAALGFSLSLPGIAGFVLTLGMAVDANVLINERIREELVAGKNSKKAVDNGFGRVFWTIFDSNVTSLIAALVLLETNSSGPIRGFAITLIMGLIVSMFTSMYCTRAFFDLALSRAKSDKAVRAWLGGDEADSARVFSFNFLRHSKAFAIFCVAVLVAVIGASVTRGVNWGVDFAGGTELQVRFAENVDGDKIKDIGKKVGVRSVTLQALGEDHKQYLIRFGAEDLEAKAGADGNAAPAESEVARAFKEAIVTDLANVKADVVSVDYVGPQIGKELRNQGFLSLFYAIVGILAYIALRFDLRFGPGAVLKMLNDTIWTVAFYVFAWRSVDLTAVAAFLTVIGYSVNDTIVIYDRIRENLVGHAKRPLAENINISLNETFTRSINTSVVTVVSLLGILFFGSGQIWNFAMAMLVGVVAATSSSTFLASSSVLWFEQVKRWWIARKPASVPQPAPAHR